jgi:glycosyltransferase 2 family protein
VSAARKIWSTSWRILFGMGLLLWIVHSIFVNEARQRADQGQLIDHGATVVWNKSTQPPRMEQWRLGWTYGPPALWQTLRSVHPGALALSLVLMGATLVIGVVRWRMVLNVHGLRLPFPRATEISIVAHFFNTFLLGTAGGDVAKAYYAARETHHKKTEAVVTVFVDRVIGLWSMLVFATVMIIPNLQLFERTGLRRAVEGLFISPRENVRALWRILWNEPYIFAAALLLLMTAVGSVFMFLAFRGGVSRRWAGARIWLRRLPKGDHIERSLDSCREFGKRRGFLTRTVLLSMTLNFVCVLQFWVLARGLDMNVSLLALCLIVPTVICVAALPLTPSGLGLRENAIVQLLAAPTIGADPTDALSLSLLAWAGSAFWGGIGGIVYSMFKQKHHLAEKELENEP